MTVLRIAGEHCNFEGGGAGFIYQKDMPERPLSPRPARWERYLWVHLRSGKQHRPMDVRTEWSKDHITRAHPLTTLSKSWTENPLTNQKRGDIGQGK